MDRDQTAAIARTALLHSTVFQKLPREIIDRLAAAGRHEFFSEPTLLMERGKTATCLRYIVAGHIVGKAQAPDGREAELIPYGVGQWMTWLGTFTSGPLVQDYWSSANASVIAFPNEIVLELTRAYPAIYPPMLEEVGHRFRTALNWIWTSNLSRSEIRTARHLLLLSLEAEAPSSDAISVSQISLARTLGISRQTLSKLLRGIEVRGFIEISYRTIRIVDPDGLRAFAQDEGPLGY